MSQIKIFHNPRCSKSRKTLELINEKVDSVEVVKYLETPPTQAELTDILTMLDYTAEELMRKGEDHYKQHIKNKNLTEQQKIELMLKYPKLIERPIVINGNNAIIGRPPENVLDLL